MCHEIIEMHALDFRHLVYFLPIQDCSSLRVLSCVKLHCEDCCTILPWVNKAYRLVLFPAPPHISLDHPLQFHVITPHMSQAVTFSS